MSIFRRPVGSASRGESTTQPLHPEPAPVIPPDQPEPLPTGQVGVYLAATLEAAVWGAELAMGEGNGRIYLVEPTGSIEDDPNLTDKKFPGNPTKSYRSREPFRVIGELADWQGHSPAQLKQMHDHLADLERRGIEAINE